MSDRLTKLVEHMDEVGEALKVEAEALQNGIVTQPWGDEYACCGAEAGSGNHLFGCEPGPPARFSPARSGDA